LSIAHNYAGHYLYAISFTEQGSEINIAAGGTSFGLTIYKEIIAAYQVIFGLETSQRTELKLVFSSLNHTTAVDFI